MNISDKIKNLKSTDLNCNVFDVYSYDGLSMQELLCQFFTKINECIKVSNETIDLASWLVNEGLKIEVANKLVLWLEDGTLENVINVNLFNTLHTKIESIEMDKDGYVSVKSFVCDDGEYVKGDGLHDDTSGFIRAINSGYPIKIPVSDYKITSKLPLTPNLKIKGEGNNSNLILFLQEGDFCFENTEDNLTRVVIDNIGFSVTTGNQNVGAIKYEKTLRGFKVSNIWCNNMAMCIYSGRGTFGTTIIENIFTTYFPVAPRYDDIPNIHIKGNTVFMKNIEILGCYKYGIKFENTEVCSLRDFNISGSEDKKMEYAIYCYKAKNLTIDRGWIEQLKLNNYGTGKEYGIYWKESEGVIDGVLLAHGSVYVDNSRSVLLRKNNFYSEGSGLIRLNGSDVKTDFNSIGGGGTFIKDLQDGNIIFTDVVSNTHNIMPNPTLKYPCDVSFITKTDTSVVIEDNLSYVSGQSADRTLKITIPSTINGEGVYFNLNSLDYQELYTFITNIKCLNNIKNVYLELPSSAKLRNQSPSCLINTNSQKLNTFYSLKVGFQSDTAKNNIGLIIEKENPSLEASILIDSCMCYRGYSSNNHTMNYNNTKMFSKNTPSGKWVVGDIVYNIDPGNSTNNFVGWVCNYVEGNASYWKKFGQVIS